MKTNIDKKYEIQRAVEEYCVYGLYFRRIRMNYAFSFTRTYAYVQNKNKDDIRENYRQTHIQP